MTSALFEYYKVYEKDELVQGTPEWHKVRELKFTASKADAIATNGKGLDTLVKELLSEYYSSQEFNEYTQKYKSEDMQRGNDFESMSRMVYEMETGYTVKEVGFVERSKYIGCSPDGMIESEKGLIEIKNHSDNKFIELLLTEKIDPKYIKQMQYQLWVTGYNWVDYFGFNPNFNPNFYKERFYPDEDMFKKFELGVAEGIRLLQNGLDILKDKVKVLEKVIEVIDEEPKQELKVENGTIEVKATNECPF